MTLTEVLEVLRDEIPDRPAWTVASLNRTEQDGSVGEDVHQFPIFEVSVDEDDEQVNLITDEHSKSPRTSEEALTLEQLLHCLEEVEAECATYGVVSRSAPVHLDDEYDARIDVQLVGVAHSPENYVFGFLQWPPEQWKGTA